MKPTIAAFVLLKVSSCSSVEVRELGRFTDEQSCQTIATALAETNRNDWLGRKGLDRFVCVVDGGAKP